MRNLIAPLILAGILGFTTAASARDLRMPKESVDQLKAICTKVGGSFSQDAKRYGCGTDCQGHPGTACIVSCKKEDETCIAQVIGGRRPRTVEDALLKPKRHRRR